MKSTVLCMYASSLLRDPIPAYGVSFIVWAHANISQNSLRRSDHHLSQSREAQALLELVATACSLAIILTCKLKIPTRTAGSPGRGSPIRL